MSADPGPGLALGTAQLGGPYGIANRVGVPSDAEVERLLGAAVAHGVRALDTARAYGDAEARLGRAAAALDLTDELHLVTKIDPGPVEAGATPLEVERAVRASIVASCEALAPLRPATVLLHRGSQLSSGDGAAWRALRAARNAGEVTRIGVSAVTPAEALTALDVPDLDVVQVAASLLDRRLERAGLFRAAAQRGIAVHVRSILLQGVAFLDPEHLPAHLEPARGALRRIAALAAAAGREPHEIWLHHARSLPAELIVLGCDSAAQLEEDVALLHRSATAPALEETGVPPLPDDVLDPSRWPRI